ncbi:hypothetical protein RNJ44_00113 [Nakaseomyces bracarensis]|uniref:AB hydrolase-1 domain-containing protein n=1 Tax=Nakaseomyces bracarensis TaxID=273131 RepID=A0ABR4P159_9SACH
MLEDEASSLDWEPVSGLSVDEVVSKYSGVPRGLLAEMVSRPSNVDDFKLKIIEEHCSHVGSDEPKDAAGSLRYKLRCWDNLDETSGTKVFVLIHGLGGSLEQFEPLIKLLHLNKLPVIAVDLPGFGGSEPLDDNIKYDMDHVADIIREIVTQKLVATTALGEWSLSLVGHSMGCYICTHLYLKLSEQFHVKQIVMCTPPAPYVPILDKANWKMQFVFRVLLRVPILFDWYRSFFDRSYGLEGSGIKNFFYEGKELETNRTLLQYWKLCQFSRNIENSSYIFFEYLVGWITPDWDSFSDALTKNGSKISVLYAENDKVVSEDGVKQLFDLFIDIADENKSLIKVEHCGHNLFYNDPKKLCKTFEENFMF